MSVRSTSHMTSTSSPPRTGSGHVKTGCSTQSELLPGAWLVLDPSKPQMGRSLALVAGLPVRILVFERRRCRRLGAVDPDVFGLVGHWFLDLCPGLERSLEGRVAALLPKCERCVKRIEPPVGHAHPPCQHVRVMERQQDYVLRTVEERGVRHIRLWFTDVLGQLKSVETSPAELEAAFAEGMQFDGSAIDGFSRVQESDVLAMPDPNSFELLPWGIDDAPSARMFCDIANLDGTPFEGDPRQVLKRNLERAREKGFTFYVSPDMEFFYFAHSDPRQPLEPLDTASYFDLTTADVARDVRKQTIQTLEAMGIPVEYSHHEDAPSQHEIDLRYTDALTDGRQHHHVPVRREGSRTRARHPATFMPKPPESVQGSGMHTHISLFEGDTNAFHDAGDPNGLSKLARGFIAGLLVQRARDQRRHQPVVNSYKAAGRRIRGADLRVVGAQQPIRRRQRAAREEGQGRVDAHRVPLARSGVQSVPRVLGHPRGRTEGHRGELRAPAGDHREPLRDDRRGAVGRRHQHAARLAVGSRRRDGALRARGRGTR